MPSIINNSNLKSVQNSQEDVKTQLRSKIIIEEDVTSLSYKNMRHLCDDDYDDEGEGREQEDTRDENDDGDDRSPFSNKRIQKGSIENFTSFDRTIIDSTRKRNLDNDDVDDNKGNKANDGNVNTDDQIEEFVQSKKKRKTQPSSLEEKDDDTVICCICLQEPESHQDSKIDCGCDHNFCHDCIHKWGTEMTNTCPFCRQLFHTIIRVNDETKITKVEDHTPSASISFDSSDSTNEWFYEAAMDVLEYGAEPAGCNAFNDGYRFDFQEWFRSARANPLQYGLDEDFYDELNEQHGQIFEVMILMYYAQPEYNSYMASYPPEQQEAARSEYMATEKSVMIRAQEIMVHAQLQGPELVQQCLDRCRSYSRFPW